VRVRELEVRRHHADHRLRAQRLTAAGRHAAAERQVATEDARIAAEGGLPGGVAEDDLALGGG
jgi:hypothetical protein